MSDVTSIPFSDLPAAVGGISNLYRDYVNDFTKVRQYYGTDFRSFQPVPSLPRGNGTGAPDRATLTDVLRDQNRTFGGSDATNRNIDLLSRDTTYAVVTGQQVGIAGGPLYTVYKTLTAIRLAEKLKETHPELNFVPVFWLEGEDHDLEEMNYVGLLNQEHAPVRVTYWPKGKPTQKNVLPVGEMLIDEHIDPFIAELERTLPNSEFKKQLLEALRAAYAPGTTFNRAFASWMNHLFPSAGIVFLSANDARVKRQVAGIFRREIEQFPAVSQLIIQRSAELEHDYHAQIKTRAMNLFLYHKGGRYLIEPREHDFSLRGTRHFLSKEELLSIADNQPELLSPNVALRPICQDTILPTVAYVAGPSEIAYFAQLEPVYRHFGLAMPAIYPRMSATVVEERVSRTLEKFEIPINELFAPPAKVQRKVIDQISEVNIEEMFAESRARLNDTMNELKFGLQYIDQTLLGALETTRVRNEANLGLLKDKAVEAQARRHETALRQLQRAAATVYPNDNYQERELNALQFMNKYGPDFIGRVSSALRLDEHAHQLIRF
jgi:bacillithiol biosynthesis cysteine-adding enzyme BshC